MATDPGFQWLYSKLSQARLESAGVLHRQHPDCHVDTGLEGIITRCNIAMLVWTAAVDIGSSLMIQEARLLPSGRSSDITNFISKNIDTDFPELGLRLIWRDLIRLHNIQHRADHHASRFTGYCRTSREAFASINQLLVPANRLAPASYEWLGRAGEE